MAKKRKKLRLVGLTPAERKKQGLEIGRKLGLEAMQSPKARRKRAHSKTRHGVFSRVLLGEAHGRWRKVLTRHLLEFAHINEKTDVLLIDALAKSLARQEILSAAICEHGLFYEGPDGPVLREVWGRMILKEEKHMVELLGRLSLLPLQRLGLRPEDGDLATRMMSMGAIEVEAGEGGEEE